MSLLDKQVISACLINENYLKVRPILQKEFFAKELFTVLDTLHFCHDRYKTDLSVDDLLLSHREKFPALPESTRKSIEKHILKIDDVEINSEIAGDVLHSFWKRTKAKKIGEEALEIYLGKKQDIGNLYRNIEELLDNESNFSETYKIVEQDVDELLENATKAADFPFPDRLLENLPGINRGNFGIVFARPEVGKTTFSCWLAAHYILKGKHVVYWANEEPAVRVKLRIIQSFMSMSLPEMRENIDKVKKVYKEEIVPYLTVIESVGTAVNEIEDYCSRNEADVCFIDQLDKVRIEGDFTRGDERLKELYCRTRELAKRNNVAGGAVSQASYEAEGRAEINYSMLDNSRTGKAGEADIIIGIGVAEEENFRTVKLSKNKINGWHGSIVMFMDHERGTYQ